MKLPAEATFIPGYYMVTSSAGRGCTVVEDPKYDHGLNLMTADKVSLDGIDDDGGDIFIDMSTIELFEPISLTKLEHIRVNQIAKAQQQRIQGQVELAQTLQRAIELGVVKNPAISQKEYVAPLRAVPESTGKIAPPSR